MMKYIILLLLLLNIVCGININNNNNNNIDAKSKSDDISLITKTTNDISPSASVLLSLEDHETNTKSNNNSVKKENDKVSLDHDETADGINDMINGFVNAVKNGDTDSFKGTKATVLSNSNVLNHKDDSKAKNFESKMKKTKEEGVKSKHEDKKKIMMENKQKKSEAKSKKAVARDKKKLREHSRKLQHEETIKAAKEESNKAKEARGKRRFERKTKKTVARARRKAEEQERKEMKKLALQKQKEIEKKSRMEKQQKSHVREAKQKAREQKRKGKMEIRQKKRNEKRRKSQKRRKEINKKKEKRQKVLERRKKKMHEKAIWKSCSNHRVHFERGHRWFNCPSGKLLVGFYRGRKHDLSSIYYYRCCSPANRNNRRLGIQSCTTANWYRSFDHAGWNSCPKNSYLAGLYKNNCNWIYCLEYARCCYVRGSRGSASCSTNSRWKRTIAARGWSIAGSHTFISSLYRSHSHYLWSIQYIKQCKIYSHNR